MNKYKDGSGGRTGSAREKAMDILLYRMRSEKELYQKLLEKGFPEEECADALAYVKSYGYVNDAEYARQYVSSRSMNKGRNVLRRELREKGIADEFIEEALEELPESDEVIMRLLIKKCGEPHKLEEKEYRRVYAFLMRRGFSTSAVISTMNEYRRQGEE